MTRYLLDTNVLLFAVLAPQRIPATVLAALSDPAALRVISVVSDYEIGFKVARGQLVLPAVFDLDRHIHELQAQHLPIRAHHMRRAAPLPRDVNRDPFDRILVGQALEEALTIVTSDRKIEALGASRLWG